MNPQPMDIEALKDLRRSYKPDKVHVMLVGESPPTKGTFFYDASGRCDMTTYTQQAFEQAHPGIGFDNRVEFLRYFQRCGCYLEDISCAPVDKKDRPERKRILRESLPAFADRLRADDPAVVVSVMSGIMLLVLDGLHRAGSRAEFRALPFAGWGTQNEYRDGLVEILRQFVPPA